MPAQALRSGAGTSPTRRLIVALALALLAACSSRADRIESSLKRGADALQAAQWDKAGLEARNVLQMDPRDERGWLLAGQAAEGRGDIPGAYKAYLEAVDRVANDPVALLCLARVELLGGEPDAAAENLARILKSHPKDPQALTLQAAALARAGNEQAAIDQLRAVIAATPQPPVETVVVFSGLLVRRGQVAQALGLLDAALHRAPSDLRLLDAAAQAAAAGASDPALAARAVEFHRQATARAPQDFALWQAWASYHLARHETDQAEAVLRGAVAAAPRDDARRLALCRFLRRERGVDVAEQAALAAIADRPHASTLRLFLAELYDTSGRRPLADRVLADLVTDEAGTPAALIAQDRLAEHALAVGESASAAAWLADTLHTNPRDPDALLLHGRLLLATGHAADAVADLRAAARERPTSAEVVALLARAHRAASEPQLARDVLADAVRARPDDASLRLLLAADMADVGEHANAIQVLDEAIRIAPRDGRAYDAKARLLLADHDPAAAEKVIRQRVQAAPDLSSAWLELAAANARPGDPRAALAVFEDGERRYPGELAVVRAHAEWLARSNLPDAAIAQYQRVLARSPDDDAAANNLAWLLADHRPDPQDLAQALALSRRFVDDDDPERLDTLGWVQLRAGQADAAVKTLQRAARLAPMDAAIELHLGMALHATADRPRGDSLIRHALATSAPLAQRAEAERLLAAG